MNIVVTGAAGFMGKNLIQRLNYMDDVTVRQYDVDTDPALCAKERGAVMQRLGTGEWKVFGAHGAAKELHIAFSDD